MTRMVTIVGSGASGANLALSLLEKGYSVEMVDLGVSPDVAEAAQADFLELKRELPDPFRFFLGAELESFVGARSKGEYYGFPPSKSYVFEDPEESLAEVKGFAPLVSHALGGLAEAWTGGCYPFDDRDLDRFPFDLAGLSIYYDRIAERIGISGEDDEMSRFFAVPSPLLPPLPLDRHSAQLLEVARQRREGLRSRFGCHVGRARVATLSVPREERAACSQLGRCLWGCPNQAFYTPALTIEACRRYPQFLYRGGLRALAFHYGSERRIDRLGVERVASGKREELPIERLALAAGTLSSSRIFLESLFRNEGRRERLTGLMDNRQILMPFVNWRMLGQSFEPHSYQFHQIAMAFEEAEGPALHGLVTTLGSSLAHPLIQRLPIDLRSAVVTFRGVRAALGLLNLNFPDHRRTGSHVSLHEPSEHGENRLSVVYDPPADEAARIQRSTRRVSRCLRTLGCIVPPGLMHVRPMGSSVHYAGTLPMSSKRDPMTTSHTGRSHDFDNLWVVDGSTFPSLPAKNLTLTLMANAARVADLDF